MTVGGRRAVGVVEVVVVDMVERVIAFVVESEGASVESGCFGFCEGVVSVLAGIVVAGGASWVALCGL